MKAVLVKTVFKDQPNGDHELQPLLESIEKSLEVSREQPCRTPYCAPYTMEASIETDLVCDSCKVHWLLEAAKEVAENAIRKDRPQ